MPPQYRDPVRSLNRVFLAGLTLEENHSLVPKPLPGGVGRRHSNTIDPRLSGLAGTTPVGEEVVFFEHLATLRHAASRRFFVAFRETLDAFLLRQQDANLYPEWLIKSVEKQKERQVFIHLVTQHPRQVPILRSQNDWLAPVADISEFDALEYFLIQQGILPKS